MTSRYKFPIFQTLFNNRAFVLAWIFYIPATNRQTSMILIPVLIGLFIIDNWQEVRAQRKGLFVLLLASLLPNLLLPFSGFISTGTLLSTPFSFATYSQFILERYHFYGTLLTQGIAGLVVMFPLGFTTGTHVLKNIKRITKQKRLFLASALGITSMVLTQLPSHACIYIATLMLLYLFCVDRDMRLGLGWFFASSAVFLSVYFYHSAYLVEAAMGLILSLTFRYQMIFKELFQQFGSTLVLFWQGKRRPVVISIAIIIISSFGFKAYDPLSTRLEAINVLVQTNRNFKDTIDYMAFSLPSGAIIYQITNKEMGMDNRIWRFYSLRERAENVKVMNEEDISAMVKVLGRNDLQFRPSERLKTDQSDSPKFFLVCSAKEKKLAIERFSLMPLQVYQRGDTVAGIYTVD